MVSGDRQQSSRCEVTLTLSRGRNKQPGGVDSPVTWTADKLKSVNLAERPKLLPDHLKEVLEKAHKLGLKTMWLYGSRARGDARPQSDFDLAFQFTNKPLWSAFVVDIAEEPPSLYKYDLVDLDALEESFQSEIMKEGLQIYECR